jgi:membrane-associated phospholipid phosphatase
MFRSMKSGLAVLCGLALYATTAVTPARADSLDLLGKGTATGEAKFASGTGNVLFLAAGTLLPLLEDGKEGKEHALRTADALLTSTLITTALKSITREKRPDGSARTSFPSGHATAAFAVATMQSHYHPKQALFWYGGATLIAASRVQLNRHYVHDVVAGAAVGYFTSRFELKSRRGLILAPFIPAGRADRRSAGGGFGLQLSKTF